MDIEPWSKFFSYNLCVWHFAIFHCDEMHLKSLHPYKTASCCHEFKSSHWSKTEKNYVSCYGPAVSGCDCKLIHHSGSAHDPQPTWAEGRSIRHGPRKRIKSVLVLKKDVNPKMHYLQKKHIQNIGVLDFTLTGAQTCLQILDSSIYRWPPHSH